MKGQTRTKDGRWIRAKTTAQDGSICAIDTGATVIRVNQSKLRRDRDGWRPIAVPLKPLPGDPVLGPLEPRLAVTRQEELVGQLHCLDFFAGSAHASEACAEFGMSPMGL